ncbi:MAG: hypothetical protein GY761_03150 [Hyphomicrobiales bacterium]|nr:hypothetical protein [Hyphomicrobiales bacterium]
MTDYKDLIERLDELALHADDHDADLINDTIVALEAQQRFLNETRESWHHCFKQMVMLENVLSATLEELTELGLDNELRERWRIAELDLNDATQ